MAVVGLDTLVKHQTEAAGHLKILPVVALDALVKRQAIRSRIARFRFLPHHIPSVARSSSIQQYIILPPDVEQAELRDDT